ncbi:hypothetical protein BGX27_005874, partial [Mortierella sp. AM989]
LKLRQVLARSDSEDALATTNGDTIQEKMAKEHQKEQRQQRRQSKQQRAKSDDDDTNDQELPNLQDLCPSGVYISMVIAYPAEVVSFQVKRPDPEPELGKAQGLKR